MRRRLTNAVLVALSLLYVGCAGAQDASGVAWKILVSACRMVDAVDGGGDDGR